MKYEDAKATLLLEHCAERCEGYQNDDTCKNCEINVAIKAIDKQIPKKPTHTGKRNIYGGVYRKCNVCGDEMFISPSAISYENYCRFCGNRLTDWEVEE